MEKYWEQVKTALHKYLKPGLCKVWIEPLRASWAGDCLILQAPSEFVASCVRDRLQRPIARACEDVLQRKVRVIVNAQAVSKTTRPVAPKPRDTQPQKQIGLPIVQSPQTLPVNPAYQFDNFVVGPSNEMAYAASQNFSRQQADGRQIFICSAPGLGKTHLIQAVGNQVAKTSNRSQVRMAYVTAEEFAGQMVMAFKAKQFEKFKARYRDNTDVLLLEDIHFFQGKEKLQAELLATIKHLQEHGRKIVFTSCFLPGELSNLDSHLTSRFCQGFISVIQKPDFATRMRILEDKARRFQISLPRNVQALLAEKLHSDVRQLESCLRNLVFQAKLLKEKICTDLAWDVLKNYNLEDNKLDMEKIVSSVCHTFEISEEQLRSRSRRKLNVTARNTAFYLARKHTDLSLNAIGKRFNRRHSTVIKGIANIEKYVCSQSPEGRRIAHTIDRMEM